MNDIKPSIYQSWFVKLWQSFPTSTKAALTLALPYTLVDAVHYYTAGTALVFSLPILVIFYLLCGGLAARIARHEGKEEDVWSRIGLGAGIRLWAISTLFNSLVAIIMGSTSLGLTLVLSVPYIFLCAPFSLIGSGLSGWIGASMYRALVARIDSGTEEIH